MPDPIIHQRFNPAQGDLSYYTYDTLTRILHELVEAYPDLATLATRAVWQLRAGPFVRSSPIPHLDQRRHSTTFANRPRPFLGLQAPVDRRVAISLWNA